MYSILTHLISVKDINVFSQGENPTLFCVDFETVANRKGQAPSKFTFISTIFLEFL